MSRFSICCLRLLWIRYTQNTFTHVSSVHILTTIQGTSEQGTLCTDLSFMERSSLSRRSNNTLWYSYRVEKVSFVESHPYIRGVPYRVSTVVVRGILHVPDTSEEKRVADDGDRAEGHGSCSHPRLDRHSQWRKHPSSNWNAFSKVRICDFRFVLKSQTRTRLEHLNWAVATLPIV